jgi:hypothetical protein
VLHARHQDGDALRAAQRALADARGRFGSIDALFEGSLLRSPEITTEFRRVMATLPHGSDMASPNLRDAILAVEDGQHARALELLKAYEAHVSPGLIAAGALVTVRQPLMMLHYWRGMALHGSGSDVAAAAEFERVANAGWGRFYTPFEYVRSFYYLGQIADARGDRAKAREYYGRFLKYWKDGDIDRDKVQAALKKVGS